jgi:hypothetical protein
MKKINENDVFQSSDLSLIATLLCFGYTIHAIDKSNGFRVVFHIRKDEHLDEKVLGFWAHSLTVDPLTYFNYLKEVKTRLYQGGE